MSQADTEASRKNMRRVALTALAGTSIEWFDFFIYGTAAALVFSTAFFPEEMPELVALIAAFGTFAVGFIARPAGGAVFGHFGDRVGRKAALVTALMIMGVATTLIGLLPPMPALVSPLHCYLPCCALPRDSPLVASGVAPCYWSRKMRRPKKGVFTAPLPRPARQWV